jgi:hypothetical protein
MALTTAGPANMGADAPCSLSLFLTGVAALVALLPRRSSCALFSCGILVHADWIWNCKGSD